MRLIIEVRLSKFGNRQYSLLSGGENLFVRETVAIARFSLVIQLNFL